VERTGASAAVGERELPDDPLEVRSGAVQILGRLRQLLRPRILRSAGSVVFRSASASTLRKAATSARKSSRPEGPTSVELGPDRQAIDDARMRQSHAQRD
jgi:hypothetical protein